MTNHIKSTSLLLSGLIGLFIPTLFAWNIYRDQLPQNLATWSMVMVMDILGVVLTYKAGNKKPFLQIGWCVAAVFVIVAIISNHSPWHWGLVETISFGFCVIAIIIWRRMGARFGLWPFMLAVYISFVPQCVDFWHHPQPETFWVWGSTVLGCIFAIFGTEKRDFSTTFVPGACIVLNGMIMILALR